MISLALRPYQQSALDALRGQAARGVRRQLLVMPTGGGKTLVATALAAGAVERNKHVLFTAARKELVDQASARFDDAGIDHGVIMAGHPRVRPAARVQIASVATLVNRQLPRADLVILDEAHHAASDTQLRLLSSYPFAHVVGLSATPWRTDGRGLCDVFEDAVVATTPAELVELGYLVPFDGFGFFNPSLDQIPVRGADFDLDALEQTMGASKVMGGIVERWLAHAGGVRTVVFAVSIAHSRALVERFRVAGVAAEHLDGEMAKPEREAILARLRAGETRVVSNVNVLTEGFDLPELTCCILARPTKSLALYLQQAGRVLRPAPGKSKALLFDHAGLLLHHGLPDEPRDYSLAADTRKQVRDRGNALTTCESCFRVFLSRAPECPECGWKNEVERTGDAPAVEIEELTEGEQLALEEIRRRRKMTIEERAAQLKLLQEVAGLLKFNRGWAAHQYRAVFGVWPRMPRGLLERVEPATVLIGAPPWLRERLEKAGAVLEVA